MSERGDRRRAARAAAKQEAYEAVKATEQRKIEAKIKRLGWKIFIKEEDRNMLYGHAFELVDLLAIDFPVKPDMSPFAYFAGLVKFGKTQGMINEDEAHEIKTVVSEFIS